MKKYALAAAIAALATLAIFLGVRWAVYGRHIEITDNAFVKADTIIVAPKISGRIAKVYVDDNAIVDEGDVLVAIEDEDYLAQLQQAAYGGGGSRQQLQQQYDYYCRGAQRTPDFIERLFGDRDQIAPRVQNWREAGPCGESRFFGDGSFSDACTPTRRNTSRPSSMLTSTATTRA